jgi:Fur family iron response transcriptional regulator
LVREVIVDPAKVFYDSNRGPHHHFYDCDTGRLIDIEADEIGFSHVPSPPKGMRLDRIDVIVRVKGRLG